MWDDSSRFHSIYTIHANERPDKEYSMNTMPKNDDIYIINKYWNFVLPTSNTIAKIKEYF